jgi:hypothetical protein
MVRPPAIRGECKSAKCLHELRIRSKARATGKGAQDSRTERIVDTVLITLYLVAGPLRPLSLWFASLMFLTIPDTERRPSELGSDLLSALVLGNGLLHESGYSRRLRSEG